jgi:hypothetical protein
MGVSPRSLDLCLAKRNPDAIHFLSCPMVNVSLFLFIKPSTDAREVSHG